LIADEKVWMTDAFTSRVCNISEYSMNPLRQIRSGMSIIVLNLAQIRVPGLRTILLLLSFAIVLALTTRIMLATDTASQHGTAANAQQTASGQAPEPEAHGISQKAIEVARFRNFPITNSMILSWVVALGLILFAQLATRNMQQVPSGAQNLLEWIVEGLYNFLEGIIGPHLVDRTFWFFATIFIFILSANWMGLIPGMGSIGWGHQTSHGFKIDQPLLRGSNADVNMTFAMALVYFACWLVWALQEIGLRGFFKEIFAPKGESTGALKILMAIVFFVAGCLEVVSILFRPISLSFRLYGNVYAGENLLEAMSRLVPGFGWLIAIPFYFMEVLMGLVQALVFMLLTAVFTMLICQHEGGEAPEAAHA
jgi:F-type H+-transporting ATPase subunit a